MSGAGSNAQAILEHQAVRKLYDITLVVTDNPASNAQKIANQYGLDFYEQPIDRFSSLQERQDYFEKLGDKFGQAGIQGVFYAGFMKISTPQFATNFPGVNVHPADLTIKGDDSIAKYRGMHALTDMARDLGYVKATVHIIDTPVDSGSSLAVSEPLVAVLNETPEQLHDRLKVLENKLYPETLAAIANGVITIDSLPKAQPYRQEGARA